jgi:hypothetical protein
VGYASTRFVRDLSDHDDAMVLDDRRGRLLQGVLSAPCELRLQSGDQVCGAQEDQDPSDVGPDRVVADDLPTGSVFLPKPYRGAQVIDTLRQMTRVA